MQKALAPTALRRQWYITASTWGGYSRVASKTEELLPLPCIGNKLLQQLLQQLLSAIDMDMGQKMSSDRSIRDGVPRLMSSWPSKSKVD